MRLWDIKRRKECGRLSGHTDGVCSLAVLPDGRLASGSYDETIRIWDVATLQEVGCLEGGHISGIDKLVPLPGNRLASGDAEWNDLMLWDLTTNSMIGDIETVAGVSMTIATAAPDGRIVLGLHDGAIRLINPDTCVLSELLRGHTRAVSAICRCSMAASRLRVMITRFASGTSSISRESLATSSILWPTIWRRIPTGV